MLASFLWRRGKCEYLVYYLQMQGQADKIIINEDVRKGFMDEKVDTYSVCNDYYSFVGGNHIT